MKERSLISAFSEEYSAVGLKNEDVMEHSGTVRKQSGSRKRIKSVPSDTYKYRIYMHKETSHHSLNKYNLDKTIQDANIRPSPAAAEGLGPLVVRTEADARHVLHHLAVLRVVRQGEQDVQQQIT
jgi:hypothetical protein